MRIPRYLPTYITACRAALSPVFIVLFLVQKPWAAVAALALAIVFEVTDLLDGYIARRYNLVSSLGKLIDPLADSIARFSIFLAFTTERTVRMHPWPLLLVALIFYRDATVAYVRTIAASKGTVLGARTSGKIKALCQGAGIIVFLLVRTLAYFHTPIQWYVPVVFYAMMIPVVLVTLASGADYVHADWATIAGMSKLGQPRGSEGGTET